MGVNWIRHELWPSVCTSELVEGSVKIDYVNATQNDGNVIRVDFSKNRKVAAVGERIAA